MDGLCDEHAGTPHIRRCPECMALAGSKSRVSGRDVEPWAPVTEPPSPWSPEVAPLMSGRDSLGTTIAERAGVDW